MVPLHETYSREKPSFWQEIRIEALAKIETVTLRSFPPKTISITPVTLALSVWHFSVQNSQARVVLHPHPISITTIDQSYFVFYRFDNFIRNAHSQVSYHIPDNLVGSLFYLHSRYESLTFFQSPLFTPNQSLAPPSRIAPRSNTLFSIFQHRVSTKSLVPSSQRGNALETTKISKSVFATGTGLRYSFAVVKCWYESRSTASCE